jgi:hypothetical protein
MNLYIVLHCDSVYAHTGTWIFNQCHYMARLRWQDDREFFWDMGVGLWFDLNIIEPIKRGMRE